MADVFHSEVSVASRHPIHGKAEYADQTAREAATYIDDDIGKVIRQLDDDTFWLVLSQSGGVATFQELGAGGFDPAYYHGKSSADVNFSSTTWTTLHSVVNITNVFQVGITRSSSDLTFDAAGVYEINCSVSFTAGSTTLLHLRLRDVGGAVTKTGQWGNNLSSTTNQMSWNGQFSVTAGQVLQLQYAVSSAASNLPAQTQDGETSNLFNLSIKRIA